MCISSTKFPAPPPQAPPPPEPEATEEDPIRILRPEAILERDERRRGKSLLSSLKIPIRS